MLAGDIYGAVLQHGEVFAGYHAFHEGLCRGLIGSVLAFVAYSSGAFYLLVDAGFAWGLFPDLILGSDNLHDDVF